MCREADHRSDSAENVSQTVTLETGLHFKKRTPPLEGYAPQSTTFMIPFIFWRVGLALLALLAAFLLSRPVIEVMLNTIRSRLNKRVRCGPQRLKIKFKTLHSPLNSLT